jgi:hypothetical protein
MSELLEFSSQLPLQVLLGCWFSAHPYWINLADENRSPKGFIAAMLVLCHNA